MGRARVTIFLEGEETETARSLQQIMSVVSQGILNVCSKFAPLDPVESIFNETWWHRQFKLKTNRA